MESCWVRRWLCLQCLYTVTVALSGRVVPVISTSQLIAVVGTNVTMNCSLNTIEEPAGLAWHYPMNMDMKQDVIAARQRYHERWVTSSMLQLTIVSVAIQDEGVYMCKSRQLGQMTVHLTVSVTLCQGNHIFHCGGGMCIFKRYRCDRISNCPDGSDEIGCDDLCESKFQCDNGQCIDRSLVCDVYHSRDCVDGSDEAICGLVTDYTGQVRPVNRGAVPLGPGQPYRANSVFGSIAAWMVGVTGVLATALLIICRIHVMRRDMRRFRLRLHGQARHTLRMSTWQRFIYCWSPAEVNELAVPTVHINLRLLPISYAGGVMRCVNDYVPTPPPYTERDDSNTPPPAYMTLDRTHHSTPGAVTDNDCTAAQTLLHNQGTAAGNSSKPIEDTVIPS